MAATVQNESRDQGDHVLPANLGGGPKGLGDPDDRSLRKAEREIIIPQKMKDKAKRLLCAEQVKNFGQCAKDRGFMMPFKCRGQAKELQSCLKAAYSDPAFVELCTEEYLQERSEFRRTGVKASAKKKEVIQ